MEAALAEADAMTAAHEAGWERSRSQGPEPFAEPPAARAAGWAPTAPAEASAGWDNVWQSVADLADDRSWQSDAPFSWSQGEDAAAWAGAGASDAGAVREWVREEREEQVPEVVDEATPPEAAAVDTPLPEPPSPAGLAEALFGEVRHHADAPHEVSSPSHHNGHAHHEAAPGLNGHAANGQHVNGHHGTLTDEPPVAVESPVAAPPVEEAPVVDLVDDEVVVDLTAAPEPVVAPTAAAFAGAETTEPESAAPTPVDDLTADVAQVVEQVLADGWEPITEETVGVWDTGSVWTGFSGHPDSVGEPAGPLHAAAPLPDSESEVEVEPRSVPTSVRDSADPVPPSPDPAHITLVLDTASFAESFATAIAPVLNERQSVVVTPTHIGAVPPGYTPAPAAPAKKSFWANAWHPDVLLSGLAMVIVLIVLLAFLT